MNQFDLFLPLFAIIILVGILFRKSSAPVSLFLLIIGMLLSLFPLFPRISFKPDLVLNVFLPLLVYEMTSETSWREVKFNIRPILLLSIGHVVFITLLVATVIHAILPSLGWPLAFILGAVIAPPDDVAIVPILEKGFLPQRLVTILKSEAVFNDATALIIFRFSLAALLTHQFSLSSASGDFIVIVISETLYGIFLGFTMGYLRLKIQDTRIQMIISLLSPFIAYVPAVRYGGCGVQATAVMGLVISHRFFQNFSPEVRLVSRSIWDTLSFTVQSLLFLLVGLDLPFILNAISPIPTQSLLIYSFAVILTVMIGRFAWVYPSTYIPRFLFKSVRKRDPYPPWQYPFIISWAGMRGSISLAAVLAVPHIGLEVAGGDGRDLVIFLVFCVILATLLFQGLTLPYVIKWLGVSSFKQQEKHKEDIDELNARIKLSEAVLNWLKDYKESAKSNHTLSEEIKFYIRKYRIIKSQFQQRFKDISSINHNMDESYDREGILLANQIVQIERSELSRLWHQDEISHHLRNKLLQELDHRSKQITP